MIVYLMKSLDWSKNFTMKPLVLIIYRMVDRLESNRAVCRRYFFLQDWEKTTLDFNQRSYENWF